MGGLLLHDTNVSGDNWQFRQEFVENEGFLVTSKKTPLSTQTAIIDTSNGVVKTETVNGTTISTTTVNSVLIKDSVTDGTDTATYSVNTNSIVADFTGTTPGTFSVVGNSISHTAYPNTRDDTGMTTPINFLYTDSTGNFISAPKTVQLVRVGNMLSVIVDGIESNQIDICDCTPTLNREATVCSPYETKSIDGLSNANIFLTPAVYDGIESAYGGTPGLPRALKFDFTYYDDTDAIAGTFSVNQDVTGSGADFPLLLQKINTELTLLGITNVEFVAVPDPATVVDNWVWAIRYIDGQNFAFAWEKFWEGPPGAWIPDSAVYGIKYDSANPLGYNHPFIGIPSTIPTTATYANFDITNPNNPAQYHVRYCNVTNI